jgi:Xaa-Pro aminopeptidase
MDTRGIDALVVQNTNDWLGGSVKWFTDIPAMNGYPRTLVFHRDGGMTVIEMGAFGSRRALDGTDPIHRGVTEILGTPSFTSVDYTHGYDGSLAADVISHRGYGCIGLVSPGCLPQGFVDALKRGASSHTVMVDATEWIDALKAIKSPEEIGLIRRTAALQDAVFGDVLEAIRPGLRDVDITALAQHAGQTRGSEQGIFLGGSQPLGRASTFVSRHLQGRTLQHGDHFSLLIEINGPGGFYTEIARTMVLGRASNELLEGFAAVREAQIHTLGEMRPGIACSDVAAAHDRYMLAHGMPAELRLYSHGQGYDMVERPLIRHDESMTLAEGMCLAVHPGYETASLFAVICDNYMLGPDGVGDCLHATEKRVFEL